MDANTRMLVAKSKLVFGEEYKYPKKWFDEHPNPKPKIVITLTSTSLGDARRSIGKNFTEGIVGDEQAVTFIYYYGKGIRATLSDDWQSYGVTIGVKGQTVGPWDLLDVEEKVVSGDDKERARTETTEAEDKLIMLLLLSKHRLKKTQNEFQRKSFINSLEIKLNALKRGQGTPYAKFMSCRIFNGQYTMLVAAMDMFLNKFPSCSDADLRFGTVTARYRDCAAGRALQHLMEVTNIRDGDVIGQWIFSEPIRRDYQDIVNKDEEWNEEHSYFPYQMDLHLVNQSPYSSKAKPNIYFFAHYVGALLGSEKSMKIDINNRHVAFCMLQSNAIAMACALSRIKEAEYKPDEPKSGSAEDWFKYLAPRKPVLEAFVRERSAAMTHCKQNTIGNILITQGLQSL